MLNNYVSGLSFPTLLVAVLQAAVTHQSGLCTSADRLAPGSCRRVKRLERITSPAASKPKEEITGLNRSKCTEKKCKTFLIQVCAVGS